MGLYETVFGRLYDKTVVPQVDSMAGMTSQPSMGAIVACTKGTKLDTGGSETPGGLYGAEAL